MAQPVLTKQDFVRRYMRGEFGNRSPTWTVGQWLDEIGPWAGLSKTLYHLRNRKAAGETFYNLDSANLLRQINKIVGDWNNWYISEMCPTEKTILQGEVVQSERHLNLLYTKVAKPMREALAEHSIGCTGLDAIGILKYHLCSSSIEWLQYLFKEYPDHVIEFSTFSEPWGTIPNMNTVFWEVRKY